ncbi:MAG: hybrid sensor histidine kinase/response regulator [Chloroflexi bacterium]|nr:hybrid sensor histidine kinase/response regulator [Chloroflexota bacterium]MCI0644625.1 hybrid sensor histidine kinase/response regulator [Chloroflexota bacterium]
MSGQPSEPKAIILYIEDDQASQRLVKRVLESHGYRVFVASEGLEGIAIARQEQPHLILMDINLPTMDGQEITTRLRSLPYFSNTPIVAVTANTSPGSRQQALAAGCSGFLTKPIDVVQFPKQVESFLQGHRDPLPEGERSHHLELYAQRLVERLENKIYELQSANQKLRELDRMKSDFIILVSHELRTPLTLISGYAYLLKEKTDPAVQDAPFVQAVADIANGLTMGVERLSQVVNEIISVSRIASGTLDLALGPTRLAIVVEQIIKEIRKTCEARNLNLDVAGLEELPMIEADGTQLKIAIGNVVNNAVKFTPNGGTIAIHGRRVGDAVDLTIQDSGVGIPPEEHRRIFEQFHILGSIQHHSTSKSAFQGGGLGLGLPIAKGIIEAHNGRIWVESEGYNPENPPGSTFHILLPIQQG